MTGVQTCALPISLVYLTRGYYRRGCQTGVQSAGCGMRPHDHRAATGPPLSSSHLAPIRQRYPRGLFFSQNNHSLSSQEVPGLIINKLLMFQGLVLNVCVLLSSVCFRMPFVCLFACWVCACGVHVGCESRLCVCVWCVCMCVL